MAVSRREMLGVSISAMALLICGAGRSLAGDADDFVIVDGWVLSARDIANARRG